MSGPGLHGTTSEPIPSTSGIKSNLIPGRSLRGQAREIIYNVATHLKENKLSYGLKYNVSKATSAATGVSESTVKRILAEGKVKCKSGLNFSTPTGKKTERKKRIEVDDFTCGAVRRKVHEFYIVRKIVPTLNKLKKALRDDGVLDCSKEFLRKLLRRLGFRWKKCQSRRKILIEKPDIAAWRGRFLQEMRKFRNDGRSIVYVDETYIHGTHCVSSCWQSDKELGVTEPIGKGQRLIIVHAGGEEGFVRNALLIFRSKQKTGDYHNDMNFDNFSKWVQQKLLPNLCEKCVIVLDNASYHNVQKNKKPNSASTKQQIQEWLQMNNMSFSSDLRKADLLLLAKQVPTSKNFKIDEIIKLNGHEVIRLPPYHPDLNPIELVWGYVKGKVCEDISSSLDDKKTLCEQQFSRYSVEQWKECCRHVKNIEKEYWNSDRLLDIEIDKVIVNLQDSCDEDSSSDTGNESCTSDSD